MKKLLSIFALTVLLGACTHSVKEAEALAECKYSLRSVEVSDYNVDSLSFDLYIGISNLSRKQTASIKRFEGDLTMNEDPISKISFENVKVEPLTTKNQKVRLRVPMSVFGKKLLGLVSMGSGTVDYHITGTAYLEGPLGTEVPVPVDIGRVGSTN